MSKSMANVDSLLECLDGSGSQKEHDAVTELRRIVANDLPKYLLAKFRTSEW
jgi:hypothetical protein